MINLGPYSGKDCPNVNFRPTILDRVLEGVAFLLLLVMWGCIYWLYTAKSGWLSHNTWVMGGMGTFCFIIMAACAYVPVRLINFPVRVNERNIGIQYLLAVRLTRVMNITMGFIFLSGVFMDYYPLANVLFSASFILLALVFLVYFIMAFKYK